jgi:hypothetical protein
MIAPTLLLWPLVPLLDRADVPRLHTLLTAGRLVGDLGTFVERFEAVATYTAVMYEEVVASALKMISPGTQKSRGGFNQPRRHQKEGRATSVRQAYSNAPRLA